MNRQKERLRHLMTLARGSEFYRPLLPEAAGMDDPVSVLRGLPLLERRVLQEEGERIRTSEAEAIRTVTKSTGGSTGAPVRILKDADGVAREMAASWAALERYGIALGDPSVRFWGTPLTTGRRLRFLLADIAMNRVRFSAFDLEEEDFRGFWRRCLRFRPTWMYGYASLMHLFANWVEDRGLDGRRVGLKAIVPTSEPLTDYQQADIERVFETRVYDEYGCGETGALAYGCERGRLHVVTENVFVECLDEQGSPVAPGEVGEVIVTDLTNRVTPLLRYRLGDRAIYGGQCDCGLSFPTLSKVLGRIHDVVYTSTGRRWHGEKINYLMAQLHGEYGGFRQYQVVQRSQHDLIVRLLADDDIAPELERRIVEYVDSRLDGMRAEVVRVDRIERERSGKIRVVRNEWLPDTIQPQAN